MLLTEDKFWQLWKGISETMFPEILKSKSSTQDQNRIKNMTHKRFVSSVLRIFARQQDHSFYCLPKCCCQSHISRTNYREVIKCARAFAFEANCRDVIQFQFRNLLTHDLRKISSGNIKNIPIYDIWLLSDPSPIIGYACHPLTDSLTHWLTD